MCLDCPKPGDLCGGQDMSRFFRVFVGDGPFSGQLGELPAAFKEAF